MWREGPIKGVCEEELNESYGRRRLMKKHGRLKYEKSMREGLKDSVTEL